MYIVLQNLVIKQKMLMYLKSFKLQGHPGRKHAVLTGVE